MFDRDALIAACRAQGLVARVVVAGVKGSAPREVGAAMLVWNGGQSGTIGGGALEFQAAEAARLALASPPPQPSPQGAGRLIHHALGPDLGQCCGGAVSLLTEVYDLPRALALPVDVIARPVAPPPHPSPTGGEGGAMNPSHKWQQTEAGKPLPPRGGGWEGGLAPSAMPLAVKRILGRARGEGFRPAASLVQGWFVEPVSQPQRRLWIWGAGHVGRALVQVLAPLPGLEIQWADVAADRFPADAPSNVTTQATQDLPALMAQAQPGDEHLILTFSHALDLALCDAALRKGFAACGLIGSHSKWARFQSRLRALGHTDAQISRIACPIGDTSLGKHPQAIAIGVAGGFLRGQGAVETAVRA
ncbi:xanthine dehydrogenase accessory protein XdhC [Neogemmobacter tilapiae]|uniref:Xanthine dehydrogenase accessory protein XdhC n=1 Tax=Neogemmobacter tilapiae TaxID=875041 RepID=A0A918TPS7_9RHOB|nr:xanthine dehydrogenase accessory protein XdhC [Gemmobacter tilapiae]GHC56347.1 xanthine dehydrogenase accessory protein XdhC [Gemmobacter tilapiae]